MGIHMGILSGSTLTKVAKHIGRWITCFILVSKIGSECHTVQNFQHRQGLRLMETMTVYAKVSVRRAAQLHCLCHLCREHYFTTAGTITAQARDKSESLLYAVRPPGD